jgi:hypothetical protein
MIVICAFVIFFALFFLVRKHAGPAHLAMIAGLSVNTLFGPQLLDLVAHFFPEAHLATVAQAVYLTLILFFPLLLYLRSARGGLSGLLRLIESAIFAALLTALISDSLAQFFEFDVIARQIADFIKSIEGYIVLAGIVSAYLDILLYHKSYD